MKNWDLVLDLSKGFTDNTGHTWVIHGNPEVKYTGNLDDLLVQHSTYFDGYSYLESGTDNTSHPIYTTKEFTAEVIFYPISTNSASNDDIVFGHGTYTRENCFAFTTELQGEDSCVSDVWFGDHNDLEKPKIAWSILLNRWHRAIATRDSNNNCRVFMDGVWQDIPTNYTGIIGNQYPLGVAATSIRNTVAKKDRMFEGYIFMCRMANSLLYDVSEINTDNWRTYEWPGLSLFKNGGLWAY